ncbi:MAG: SDR family oxidoreductase [Chlorobium sp.]
MAKTIVITGSTRGIGFGLAHRFLEKGCNVMLNGRTPESTRKAHEQLKQYSGRVGALSADISRPEGITQLYEAAERQFGRVDIWINNAGIVHKVQNAWELDPAALKEVLTVNIDGVVNGTIIPFRRMQQQGGGKIFNMEGLGSDGFMIEGMTIYGTTKSALTYFTRSFAKEASGTSVQIGTLSPGMVVTDMLRGMVSDGSAESLKKRKFFNLMADDVETVSAFLCEKILASTAPSPQIKWLTKQKMMARMVMAPFKKRDFFS